MSEDDPIGAWRTATAPSNPCRASTLDDIDEVAVERACEGDMSINLSRAEMALAFRILDSRGYSTRRIGLLLGVSQRTASRWRGGHHFPCSRIDGRIRRMELRQVAS